MSNDSSSNGPADGLGSPNIFPPGVTEASVLDAVKASGYPLQSRVAEFLRKKIVEGKARFGLVQEEWAYIDSDTGTLRTLDVIFELPLFGPDEIQAHVRPAVILLIECKQSEMPYVFFGSPLSLWTWSFPIIAGLFRHSVRVTSNDDPSTWSVPLAECLGFSREKLIADVPRYSSTFAKCARKGKDLELSGIDAYQSLVLPLLKATRHFRRTARPPKTAQYFDVYATIPVAVIDGPMLYIDGAGSSSSAKTVEWVRVLRHQIAAGGRGHFSDRVLAVDVVHVSFLAQYLDKFVIPFGESFSQTCRMHEEILVTGKAFAAGMGEDSWTNLVSRLRPSDSGTKFRRAAMIAQGFAALFRGRLNGGKR